MECEVQKDWLKYFEHKEGIGAVICEGPEISAACDEIRRLRNAERLHAELVEAVRWERNAMRVFNEARMPDAGYGEITWAAENLEKARAAVDALVGEG